MPDRISQLPKNIYTKGQFQNCKYLLQTSFETLYLQLTILNLLLGKNKIKKSSVKSSPKYYHFWPIVFKKLFKFMPLGQMLANQRPYF
jgi:hypothetical protein